jgi:hypothetical protein
VSTKLQKENLLALYKKPMLLSNKKKIKTCHNEKACLFNLVSVNRGYYREQSIQSPTRMAGRDNNISHNNFLYL